LLCHKLGQLIQSLLRPTKALSLPRWINNSTCFGWWSKSFRALVRLTSNKCRSTGLPVSLTCKLPTVVMVRSQASAVARPYGNISCELHSSHVESHMCISDITCVKKSHVLVSENTLIKRSNWSQVYFAQRYNKRPSASYCDSWASWSNSGYVVDMLV